MSRYVLKLYKYDSLFNVKINVDFGVVIFKSDNYKKILNYAYEYYRENEHYYVKDKLELRGNIYLKLEENERTLCTFGYHIIGYDNQIKEKFDRMNWQIDKLLEENNKLSKFKNLYSALKEIDKEMDKELENE